MKIIAGIDIGNATTEVALAQLEPSRPPKFLASGIAKTSGIKGTKGNINGVFQALYGALKTAGLDLEMVDEIMLNEAAPVIGDVAMETITETIITESTMIGHNPSTPGGIGIAAGTTVSIHQLKSAVPQDTIAVVPKDVGFEQAAEMINAAPEGVHVTGAIIQQDDGVLVHNRLKTKIPIVDEVLLIEKVPLGMKAAIEVADKGGVVEALSNPYGIATMFALTSEETKQVVPIARALIGNRSAVVIKTNKGDVKERRIPAGYIQILGEAKSVKTDIEAGAEKIMEAIGSVESVMDVRGEAGTNSGGMLERVRQVMAKLTDKHPKEIMIQDLLAVDTTVPQSVTGGIAGEYSMENAVGIAAMVRSDKLQMELIAGSLSEKVQVPVTVGGVEADMAIRGALTTPGSEKPLAILDMGAGSTDASVIDREGQIKSIHMAGAGNMVSMIIQSELGLEEFQTAEEIKKYPLAKVESLFHIRHEDGSVEFFEEALDPTLFARVVLIAEDKMIPLQSDHPLEKVRLVRIEAKEKVFVTNAIRALEKVSPGNNIRSVDFVIMVGGSSIDFEIPQLITDKLSQFKVVAGRGNIRGSEGPRNAVATGLVLAAHSKAVNQK